MRDLLKGYSVVIEGRPYKVELVKHDERALFLVRVNDKPVEVELLGKFTEKAPFSIKMREKVHNVELNRVDRQAPFPVRVNNVALEVVLRALPGKVVQATVPSLSPRIPAKSAIKTVEEGTIVAPMAGKIVSVGVSEGDSVKVGAVVCVLEAMKMENEVTATKTGSIEEVRVSEGMAVSEGDVLVVIK